MPDLDHCDNILNHLQTTGISVRKHTETYNLVNPNIPFYLKSLPFAFKRYCEGQAIVPQIWIKNGEKSCNGVMVIWCWQSPTMS